MELTVKSYRNSCNSDSDKRIPIAGAARFVLLANFPGIVQKIESLLLNENKLLNRTDKI